VEGPALAVVVGDGDCVVVGDGAVVGFGVNVVPPQELPIHKVPSGQSSSEQH